MEKPINLDTYKTQALRTDFRDYGDYHTGDASARLDYGVTGLVTESAKVLDLMKKSKKGLRPLDTKQMEEELGDLLWYMNLTLDELGLTFEDTMRSNIAKIDRKYPNGDTEVAGLIRGKQ